MCDSIRIDITGARSTFAGKAIRNQWLLRDP